MTAANLGKTLAGVAALVQSEIDQHERKQMISGVFQPYDLPDFLCLMAEVADTMSESVSIGSDAEFILRDRWEKRALALGFTRTDCLEASHG